MNTLTTSKGQISSVQKSQKRGRQWKINWWRIIAYIVLLIMAILYLGPLLMLVNTSLKTLPEFFKSATGLPASPSLDNFVEAWEKASNKDPLFVLDVPWLRTEHSMRQVVDRIFQHRPTIGLRRHEWTAASLARLIFNHQPPAKEPTKSGPTPL